MFLMHLALLAPSEVKGPPNTDNPPVRPSDDKRPLPNKFNLRKQGPPGGVSLPLRS